MRNKERIKEFTDKLAEYWEKVPDWRFGQLIVNVLGTCKRDPFFYEEDEMLQVFEEYFNENIKTCESKNETKDNV